MELEQMEIHNAVPEYAEPLNGWRFPRYPEVVRDALSPRGKWVAAHSTAAELRFMVAGPDFKITLSNPGEATEVTVRRGSFWHSKLELGAGQTRTFLISGPERLHVVEKAALDSGAWHPDLWRIQFDNATPVLLELDPLGNDIRPPKAEEKPGLRWLAYGSSITNSSLLGYPSVAAQILNVDVLNKGLSGACHIEPQLADWLASLDFDFATLELGVNMRGGFEPPEFEKRVRYLLKVLRERHPTAPLVLITHFLNMDHHVAGELGKAALHQLAYDTILLDLHSGSNDPNLHLVEGTEVLDKFCFLTADFIHPTTEGQSRMGNNLARMLGEILEL